MEKRRQNIIIWFIVWASLLLVVLYSPIGSPDLYKNDVYYSNVTGQKSINFTYNRNEIKTPVLNNPSISKEENINIANNPTESKKKVDYQAAGNNNSSNEYAALPMIDNNSGNSKNNDHGSINSSENSFAGTFASRSGSKSNPQSTFQNNGLISTSTDLSTIIDNDMTRQGTETDNPLGTTDPGGDPFGPPIPVPDGWGFLLVLAGIYAIAKKYFFK